MAPPMPSGAWLFARTSFDSVSAPELSIAPPSPKLPKPPVALPLAMVTPGDTERVGREAWRGRIGRREDAQELNVGKVPSATDRQLVRAGALDRQVDHVDEERPAGEIDRAVRALGEVDDFARHGIIDRVSQRPGPAVVRVGHRYGAQERPLFERQNRGQKSRMPRLRGSRGKARAALTDGGLPYRPSVPLTRIRSDA